MPSWITHLVTADKVLKNIEVKDKNSFLFGNVMPDILNNYIVKNTNIHKEYEETHFAQDVIINGIECKFPGPNKFLEEYKDKMTNPVVLGFYSHLLADYYWNDISYGKYFKGSREEVELKFVNGETKVYEYDDAVAIKQQDFSVFTRIFKT